MDTAICPKCHIEKPLSAFNRDKNRKNGHTPYCKACRKVYQQKNQKRIKESKALSYQKNKPAVLVRVKKYGDTHQEQRRQYSKAYHKAHYNPELARRRYLQRLEVSGEVLRAQKRTYAQQNSEALRVYKAQWVKDNPDKMHAAKSRRRTREAGALYVEAVSLDVLYQRDKGICQLCHKPCKRQEASRDHVVPIVEGGEHSYRNCVLAHRRCNSGKGARHIPQQQRLFG
jgi:5-methylcytosine-specific restriction endonuclease McrA